MYFNARGYFLGTLLMYKKFTPNISEVNGNRHILLIAVLEHLVTLSLPHAINEKRSITYRQ